MADQAERTGVFISYATRDGAAFAAGLRSALESEGVFCWQDVIQLPRVVGQEWWKRITDGIDHVNYLIMVLTPAAFERETVLQEWRYARRCGVCVIPVKASPEVDIQSLPRWMRKVQFAHLGDTPTLETFRRHDDGQAWKGLIEQIFSPCEKPDYAFMVDKNDVYVPRAALSGQVVDLLLDREQKAPRAIISALRGAGGFGKTTLARAICFDDAVQDAFSDGILWVTLGESATMDTVRVKLNTLIEAKTHQRSDRDFESAKTRLRELLDGQEVLIVIDDVWKREHAEPFLRLGDHLTTLITTRMDDVLPHSAQRIPIAGMERTEAADLIAYGFSDDDKQTHAAEFRTLAERLGEYALLLKLANGTLHDRVRAGELLAKALDHLKRALEKRGITKAIQIASSDDRSRAVDATLRLSIERLSDLEREWFKRLAIFPEDAVIPFATLEKAWDCDDLDVEDACAALNRLSLVLHYDLNARTITLHDIVRAYLREQAMESEDALKTANTAFLDAYGVTHWRDLPSDEPYLWDNLAYHLIEAGRSDEFIATVLDLRYLAAKTIYHGTAKVETDIIAVAQHIREKAHPQADALTLLERNYRNMTHIVKRCETVHDALITIYTRLSHLEALKSSRDAALNQLPFLLVPLHSLPDAPHPLLLRTLTGHTSWISSVTYSPDGTQLASVSGTELKVWDARSGFERLSIFAHPKSIRSVSWSPDGRWIATASSDRTVKIWDALSGEVRRTLIGHTYEVWDAVWSIDGRWIISAAEDRTARIWDPNTGIERTMLTGPTKSITSLTCSPDGRLVAGASRDFMIMIWDLDTGAIVLRLELPGMYVTSVGWSPDSKRIVGGTWNRLIKVWNAETGKEILSIEGHTKNITCVAWSPSGKYLLSASEDKLLQVWNAETGELKTVLNGHLASVTSASWSPDGSTIVSSSDDSTIKLWDSDINSYTRGNADTSTTSIMNIGGTNADIIDVAWSRDGMQVAGVSSDRIVRVWNAKTGKEYTQFPQWENSSGKKISREDWVRYNGITWSPDSTRIALASDEREQKIWDTYTGDIAFVLTGHTGGVSDIDWSPDGKRIVTASSDRTLMIWNAITHAQEMILIGHIRPVTSVSWSLDGQWIVSGGRDQIVRLWNSATGIQHMNFVGHTESITDTCISPDSQYVVSASEDTSIRIWSMSTRKETAILTGHVQAVNAVAYSPNGRWIVSTSSDKVIRVWNGETQDCCAIFFAEAPLRCCAWSPDGKHIVAGGDGGYLYWLRWIE